MSLTAWEPGKNCDLVLKHPDHESLPLVCYRQPRDPLGPRVRIHYEVYWPDDLAESREPVEVRHLWFTVLAADPMVAPDGSWFPFSVQEIRTRLNDILLKKQNIRLTTTAGTIRGLYSDNHVVIDTVYPSGHTLEIHLSTRLLHDLPAVPLNMWLDEADVSSTTWGTAIWQG